VSVIKARDKHHQYGASVFIVSDCLAQLRGRFVTDANITNWICQTGTREGG
jgi:hypothetical protein